MAKVPTVVVPSLEKILPKVDRSAAYATRHIAKNLVAGLCSEVLYYSCLTPLALLNPVGLYVNTYGTAKVKHDRWCNLQSR